MLPGHGWKPCQPYKAAEAQTHRNGGATPKRGATENCMDTQSAGTRSQTSKFNDEHGVPHGLPNDAPSMKHAGDNSADHIMPDNMGHRVGPAGWQAEKKSAHVGTRHPNRTGPVRMALESASEDGATEVVSSGAPPPPPPRGAHTHTHTTFSGVPSNRQKGAKLKNPPPPACGRRQPRPEEEQLLHPIALPCGEPTCSEGMRRHRPQRACARWRLEACPSPGSAAGAP